MLEVMALTKPSQLKDNSVNEAIETPALGEFYVLSNTTQQYKELQQLQ